MSHLCSWQLGLRYTRWKCVAHDGGMRHARGLHEVARFFLIRNINEGWPYPIYASDRLRDRKSVFLAHASTLPISSAFPTFLDHLTNLPNLKRATHCMYAYRTSGPNGLITGQSDGAESGSGDRLARLLETTGCDNVVVVVSRWYGGVKLGSDRWKRISDVAKEALARGKFINRNEIGSVRSNGSVNVTKGKQKKK